mgnify:CR=1 FL=1
MIDYVKNLRLPLLGFVLVLTAVLIVSSVVQFVMALVGATSLGQAAQIGASTSPSLVWVLTALVLVMALVLLRPHPVGTMRMVRVASVVIGFAAVLAAVYWVLLLWEGFSPGVILGSLGGLVETIAKGACAVVLHRLHGVGRTDVLAALGAQTDANPKDSAAETGESQRSAWQVDQTTGYHWTSAAQAAQGGAPTGQPPELEGPETAAQYPSRQQVWSRPKRSSPDWGSSG